MMTLRGSLLLSVLILNGCALTTMAPAHKLEQGEAVWQFAIDEPGTLFIPRLSAQGTFGTGGTDLGLHVGTSFTTLNGGGTARVYIPGGLATAIFRERDQLTVFPTPNRDPPTCALGTEAGR